MGEGQVMTGGVESVILTKNLHDAVFATASVATHVTDEFPIGNVPPVRVVEVAPVAEQTTLGTLWSSVALTDVMYVTATVDTPPAGTRTVSRGHAIVGGVPSSNTLKTIAAAVKPIESVKVHVTLVP